MELHSITFPGLPEQYKVAPASHLDDKNNPHGVTPEQIGAAPSGYGLGDRANYPENNDVHSISKSGWYLVGVSTQNAVGTYGLIQANVYDDENAVLFVYGNTGSINARKIKQYGTWGEWEWVNPPMALGVEYRTTERWNGKAVYIQMLNFGALPNSTGKNFNASVSGATKVQCFDLGGIFFNANGSTTGALLGLKELVGHSFSCTGDGFTLGLVTNGDVSAFNAYPVVKYTKD